MKESKEILEIEGENFDDFDELLRLGENYEELNNIISNAKDRGVVNVSEILCEIDFLREATHRNTKKALIYATYKNHQQKLKKLARNNSDMVRTVGRNGKFVRNYIKKNDYKNKSFYNRKALRKELKNVSLDVPSGGFYKNIRGREKSFSRKNFSKNRHLNFQTKNTLETEITEAKIVPVNFCAKVNLIDDFFCKVVFSAS